MPEEVMAVESKPEIPPTDIRMTKQQAAQLAIGDTVGITVEGQVNGIRECYLDNNFFVVSLKPAGVSSIKGNAADKAMQEMTQIANEADKNYQSLGGGKQRRMQDLGG